MQNLLHSTWKNLYLILCAGMILHNTAAAQCTNNLSSHTYDTLLTGPGYGTYHVSFPKWSADSGLLVSVKINALVNVQYDFTLKNVDVLSGSYSLWVGREDRITSSSLTAPYDNITEQKIGVYDLDPGNMVAMPSFPFLNNYANIDSISGTTAPFLGIGNVSFTYAPITYTNIHTSNNASYSYHATASDATHFSLTYIYCKDAGVLASSLTAFTATLKDPVDVQLDWKVTGEEKDRIYEVQRSRDGQVFTTIASLTAAGTGPNEYTYSDRLPEGGKWHYRLKIIAPAAINYSPVREVSVTADGAGKMVIFPNPAVDHINLVLPGNPNTPGDWRIDILASDGRLVQKADFFHVNNFFLNFRQTLSPGVYFVRAVSLQGQGSHVASFRVD